MADTLRLLHMLRRAVAQRHRPPRFCRRERGFDPTLTRWKRAPSSPYAPAVGCGSWWAIWLAVTCLPSSTRMTDASEKTSGWRLVAPLVVAFLMLAACSKESQLDSSSTVYRASVSPNGKQLIVEVPGGAVDGVICTAVTGVKAQESNSRVLLTATTREICDGKPGETVGGVGFAIKVDVFLRAPVGKRALINDAGEQILLISPFSRAENMD